VVAAALSESTTAGVITATGTMFTAVALVITAVAALIRSRRVEGKIDEVHVIVNQQRTDAQNYNRALIAALTSAGVAVPADQSVDPGPTG
jgi:Na+-transporting NADH:ubiquinone oxidoreductase subunit NqrF